VELLIDLLAFLGQLLRDGWVALLDWLVSFVPDPEPLYDLSDERWDAWLVNDGWNETTLTSLAAVRD
jgi:hypothetical protein